jgi:hypothetical protein
MNKLLERDELSNVKIKIIKLLLADNVDARILNNFKSKLLASELQTQNMIPVNEYLMILRVLFKGTIPSAVTLL